MTKSKIIIGWIFILCVLFSSCSLLPDSSDKIEDAVVPSYSDREIDRIIADMLDEFKPLYRTNYQVEKYNIDELKSCGGLVCRKNSILLTDKEQDKLIEIDFEGNILQTIGKTGSGHLEFQEPSRITEYEDEIYIIDQRNHRVQVLDEKLNFSKEILFATPSRKDPGMRYEYIAVGDKGLYLSSYSLFTPEVHLYEDDTSRNYEVIGKNFIGPLHEDGGIIYGVNREVNVPIKDGGSLRSGPNWIFKLGTNDEDFQVIDELSPGLGIVDFVIENHQVIMMSNGFSAIYAYDTQNSSFEGVIQLDREIASPNGHFSSDKEGSYWVASPENNLLYHVMAPQN